MNGLRRDVVRMVAVVVLIMAVPPLVYRVWTAYHPSETGGEQSFSGFLVKAVDARALALLKTPLAQWSAADRQDEPEIAAWLEACGQTVLPWEWTDEARRKDPAGYRKAWERAWSTVADGQADRMRHDHLTNQIARVASGEVIHKPTSVSVERLTKGRFWGWNRHLETYVLTNELQRSELLARLDGEQAELQMKVERVERFRRILKRAEAGAGVEREGR